MVEKIFTWLGAISEKRPWFVILAIVLITAAAVAGMSRIRSEFGYKTMLPKHSESVKALNKADEVFGGVTEEQVLIEAPNVLDGAVLKKVADYAADLKKQKSLWPEFAKDVVTPLDDMVYFPGGVLPQNLSAPNGGTNGFESLLAKYPQLSEEELAEQVGLNLEVAQKQAERLGLGSRSQTITNDNRALLITVKLNPKMKQNEQMKRVKGFENWTRDQFKGLEGAGVYVTGSASVNKDANDRTMKDMRMLMLFALVFIVFILFLTFRRLSDVLLTMLVIIVTVIWVMGLGGWLGFPFTYTTSGIIPLLLGIDIAYAIHVLSRYYEERRKGQDPHKSALRSVVTVGVAVFLTAATTAFGFASFGISNMPPIQQFGALCVAGVLISFVLAVTLLPACLILRDRGKKSVAKWEKRQAKRDDSKQSIIDKVLVKVAIVSEHHRKIVLVVTTIIIIGCIALGTQIGTEADMQKMMPADMPSAIAQAKVNEHFGGQDLAYTLVSVEASKGSLFKPETLNAIIRYEDGLAASGAKSEKGEILFKRDKMISLADLVKKANNGSIPQTEAEVMSVLMGMRTGSRTESSNRLINPDHPDVTMISVRLKRGPQNDMKKITETLRAENKKIAGQDPDLELTSSGLPVLITDLMNSIVPTQIKTSAAALVLCALIVVIVFGSLFFGLAATSVVFIGIALEIGTLVLLGWPLDFMTVMVSSLVIGAGIDFGIHVTHRFREEWHHGGVDIDEAMRRTVGNVGKALVAAAVTTAGAFAIIAISQVSYMRRFGGITALSLMFALLAALLVLPSILAWRAASVERKRDKKAAAPEIPTIKA
jgi:uncharacterized protein